MNKKIISGLVISTVLASSVFAFNCNSDMKKGYGQQNGSYKMMKKKGSHHKKDGRIMKMVMMLDLSDAQRTQIRKVIQDNRKNKINPYSAFSETNFDKTKFIELSQKRKDSRVESKAELISKIYNVLNSSQKKDLKTMLDMRKVMNKGDFNGKNCNGRR